MIWLYDSLVYEPLYNGLIFLMEALPYFNAGIIIIIFTIIVKLIMLPLSIKASKAQLQMKGAQKELQEIKEKHKDNKEELSRKTIEYYREKGINPFASIFILLIQLPILIGLYQIFLKSGLPQIYTELLYSFISVPHSVNMVFLKTINISEKSLMLALLAGLTTYIQISLANKSHKQKEDSKEEVSGDLAKAMAIQMKYFFPLLMTFISYTVSSALAIYFVTSNIFAIGQEIYIKKKYHKSAMVV